MSDPQFSSVSSSSSSHQTRGYQQEMLEESLRSNMIIALDTGSGKTHIAILRMKHEAEREPKKISWFVAPTVALCEQQRDVISTALPVSVGLISGALEPDQWKDPALWRRVIEDHRIMVTTPQVFLDALRHGYVSLGRDVGLIVFDEAHHAVDNHPYNRVMKEFYLPLPARGSNKAVRADSGVVIERPMILGLTASPIFGGHVERAFQAIESNLDSVIRAPKQNRRELASFVHRPVFKHVMYDISPYYFYRTPKELPSVNLQALESVLETMDIEEDPYVLSLRSRLASLPMNSPERARTDQKLSKTIQKEDSYTHKGLRDFARAAAEICIDLGPWAADWYIEQVLKQAMVSAGPYHQGAISAWQQKEKNYLLSQLARVVVTPVSMDPQAIVAGTSDKVQRLVDSLLTEEREKESFDEDYSGLVFVTRRDAVIVLAEVLTLHPRTADNFNVGCLLGTSQSTRRHSFLDITQNLVKQSQADTLRDFRNGEKNLIVSTAVAEEGIDIQACGNVIRWDPPVNMASWAQSRGRARRKRSSFVLMFEKGGVHAKLVNQWEHLEAQMMALYHDEAKKLPRAEWGDEMQLDDYDDEELFFTIQSTGATLTLHSAIEHLAHFCAVLPDATYGQHVPVYDIDPPDFPEGWHAFENRASGMGVYLGPYGATVSLPRYIEPRLRVYSTPRIHPNKISARRHAAYFAYLALYEAGLLNDHLLPLSSVVNPPDEDVAELLKDVEKRAGMAGVTEQMNPWLPTEKNVGRWRSTRVSIAGLPPCRMFTQTPINISSLDEATTIYRPGRAPETVSISKMDTSDPSTATLNTAREYTRRIFWPLSGPRMTWDNLSFAYLFLPEDTSHDSIWAERRLWANEVNQQSEKPRADQALSANAEALGQRYSFPDDLIWVRDGRNGKVFRFLRWQHDPLSPSEEETVMNRYARFGPFEISYPLLAVQNLHRRVNFLVPTTSTRAPSVDDTELFLFPKRSAVDLISLVDTQYASLLPSILHGLTTTMIALSLRDQLLTGTSLSQIPVRLLTTAISAPVAQGASNYQRLESLGDTVLKFVVGIQLMAEFPLWHEGYLSKRKDHAVANSCLAKHAILKELYRWIIREGFAPKKWKPFYTIPTNSKPPTEQEAPKREEVAKQDESSKQGSPKRQQLSTKVLADVVEALIGAAYLHGGIELGLECAQFFDLGLKWRPLSMRLDGLLSGTRDLDDLPPQISQVEKMLGYTFDRKVFVVEALTHPSYHSESSTRSYDRYEFLGDSVLDMLVTDYLFHAPGKEYSPGHLHIRKSAVVNSHFLAYICLRTTLRVDAKMPKPNGRGKITLADDEQSIYLWQCLLHSSPRVLQDLDATFGRYRKVGAVIEKAFRRDWIYPWAALTRLQAPKFFSDIIESILGAVYLDSGGNLGVVRQVLVTLGIWEILERIVRDDIDVLHPVSRLSIWVSKQQKSIEYKFVKEKGMISCSILVDEEEKAVVTERHRSRASQEEVKFTAAERAIKVLHLTETDGIEEDDDEVADVDESEGSEDEDEEMEVDALLALK
ncbi:hypothetical protein JAAARDRAFT_582899 [Jaapia argillacea MUCL 33604]|uniref:P-loop containing nucleoside triphosphate hydrolase protein n=1 Tax=Jaapia argillacea MUCL 33604 TaxID=933084 RepID=A0A067P6M1_9AGAM|nr:hypothetical protein JAAARDRAFT_582899 [Jaapia argillacea MUCL 33604]